MYRYLIVAVAAGIAGGFIARSKGYNQLGWSLMCLIIPLLVVVILLMPARVYNGKIRTCPNCKAIVREGDHTCKECGKKLS